MRNGFVQGVFATVGSGWFLVGSAFAAGTPMHLELDLTGAEYSVLLEQAQSQGLLQMKDGDALQDILALGKRNLEWLEFINAKRAPGQKLELSTPATQVGIPITQPREANRKITLDKHAEVLSKLPQFMKDVLIGKQAFHDQIPISDDDFLIQLRAVDGSYQRASRWLLQEPNLWAYAGRMADDVRGYYFLKREPDLQKKLADFSTLPAAKQAELSEWLVGQCRNSGASANTCKSELKSKGAAQHYSKYLTSAASHFQTYFEIENPRREVRWNGDNLIQPFQTPKDSKVQQWLVTNIEDEWRQGSFGLKLEFQQSSGIPYVVFSPGATPNVNGLGGDRITMDANRSIEEYTTRWTIRHEYGHVLGFPDCYLEFYDESRGVMINYQIDLDNLMCSRRGHLLPEHVEMLKKHY